MPFKRSRQGSDTLIHERLYHPMFQVIDQDGMTYGLSPHWSGTFDVAGHRNDLVSKTAGEPYFCRVPFRAAHFALCSHLCLRAPTALWP